MRFIALRCKDTIAPVGTIAQGLDKTDKFRKDLCMKINMDLQQVSVFMELCEKINLEMGLVI